MMERKTDEKTGHLGISRRAGEKLFITAAGVEIVVEVAYFKGNQVKLWIHAPKEVLIDREEIHLRREADKRLPNAPPSV